MTAMSEFVDWTFNGKHTVKVPRFEVESLQSKIHECRLDSMQSLLKSGDTYFDIGTEHGWFAPVFARWVGEENMCLFEPQPFSWGNIKATWEANCTKAPKSTFCGFIGNSDRLGPVDKDAIRKWPKECSYGFQFKPGYAGFPERPDIPAVTIDSWVEQTGIIPKAIGMNIEGAEAIALVGGQDTFKKHHPLVWVAMHVYGPGVNGTGPSPIEYDYGTTCEKLIKLMESCGYETEFLGEDFEHQYLFK
jgi:FkbM family methyltransferase